MIKVLFDLIEYNISLKFNLIYLFLYSIMLINLETRSWKLQLEFSAIKVKKSIVYYAHIFNKTIKKDVFEHTSVSYQIPHKYNKKDEENKLFEMYRTGQLKNDLLN